MLLPYPSADFLEINHQVHNDILVGRWLRPVTEAEARQGYDNLLAATQPHHARYWLLESGGGTAARQPLSPGCWVRTTSS